MPEDRAASAQLDLALRADRVRLPRDLRPMLPVDGAEAFDSPDHLFDAWWGGVRVLAFVDGSGAVLVDEHGADVSDRFRAVTASLAGLGDAGLVLDGEIVADGVGPGDAPPRPGPMPVATGPVARSGAPALVVQDLLVLEGRSLLAEPLQRRRVALAATIAPRDAVVVAEPVPCDGIELLDAAATLGLFGVVAKRRDAPYLPGTRSALWIRIPAAASGEHGPRGSQEPGAEPPDRAAIFAPAPLRRALVLLRGLPLEDP